MARALYFWPGLKNQVWQEVDNCTVYKEHGMVQHMKIPVIDPPNIEMMEPMNSLGTDILYFEGKPILILVDKCSGYKQIFIIKDSSTGAVGRGLEIWFTTVGVPVKIDWVEGLSFTRC